MIALGLKFWSNKDILEIFSFFVGYYWRFQIYSFQQRLHDFVSDSIQSISVYFRFLTARWYAVTKGKILSSAFFFGFTEADGLAHGSHGPGILLENLPRSLKTPWICRNSTGNLLKSLWILKLDPINHFERERLNTLY